MPAAEIFNIVLAARRIHETVIAPIARHKRWITILSGLTIFSVWTLRIVWEQSRTQSEQIQGIVCHICIDSSGGLDEEINNGTWRTVEIDADLTGDGSPERVLLFYDYRKWGENPKKATQNYKQENDSKRGWLINGMLLLKLNGTQWQPVSYHIWDYDGTFLRIARSSKTRLHYLVSHSTSYEPSFAWGVSERGGSLGSLPGIITDEETSQATDRFEVRSFYPQ